MKRWTVRPKEGLQSFKLEEVPIPEVRDYDVMIKVCAVSLNYRDIMVATVRVFTFDGPSRTIHPQLKPYREPITTAKKIQSCQFQMELGI